MNPTALSSTFVAPTCGLTVLPGLAQASPPPAVETPWPAPTLDLKNLWTQLQSGDCCVEGCRFSTDYCYFGLRFRAAKKAPPRVTSKTRRIIERVLLGDSQKLIAVDLGLSPSYIALACSRGLSAIAHERRASLSPIVLVMSVHAAHGYALPLGSVQISPLQPDFWNVRVKRPDVTLPAVLSPGEQMIARYVIEGETYSSISLLRRTSVRTIANQVASLFRKLEVSARTELRAQLVKVHAVSASFGSLVASGGAPRLELAR